MSKELSAEWEQRIETEGHEITKRFKDNNDYQSGYIQGVHDGYDQGATKYVKELIEAQERIKDLESYLDRIANGAQPYNDREAWSWIETARQLANESLSPVNPQKKEDAQGESNG